MIESFRGKTDEDIKTQIESLSQGDLQSLIKEGQEKYQQLAQRKSAIDAEIKITNENYEAEMKKLKDLGINSIEELDKAIEEERNTINKDLTNLVKIINEVE